MNSDQKNKTINDTYRSSVYFVFHVIFMVTSYEFAEITGITKNVAVQIWSAAVCTIFLAVAAACLIAGIVSQKP